MWKKRKTNSTSESPFVRRNKRSLDLKVSKLRDPEKIQNKCLGRQIKKFCPNFDKLAQQMS